MGVGFGGVPHERGLEDHETLLADAIRPKPVVNTHGQVVDQSSSPPQGREGERERLEGVAHHYCHGVAHSGHSASPSVCSGRGRLAGDTLPLLPSINLSLFHLTPTHTQACFSLSHSLSPISFVSANGDSCVMLSSPPTFLPVHSYWFWPRGSGMSSFPILAQSPSYT